jgi:hypothetical protein
MTIRTKHGSQVVIIGLLPAFGDHERVIIEFLVSGHQTDILVDNLVETRRGEIRRSINKLKEEKNEGRS